MCCAFLLAFGIGPRIALLAVWIFGDRVQHAFNWWGWALLGLLFLPWTTLMYVLVWSAGGLSFWGWLLVALGVFLDVATYSGRFAKDRYESSTT